MLSTSFHIFTTLLDTYLPVKMHFWLATEYHWIGRTVIYFIFTRYAYNSSPIQNIKVDEPVESVGLAATDVWSGLLELGVGSGVLPFSTISWEHGEPHFLLHQCFISTTHAKYYYNRNKPVLYTSLQILAKYLSFKARVISTSSVSIRCEIGGRFSMKTNWPLSSTRRSCYKIYRTTTERHRDSLF